MPKKSLIILLSLLAIAGAGPTFLGRYVLQEFERRISIQVEGEFQPAFFRSAFSLRRTRCQWKDKVRLISGDLKVEYDLLKFLAQGLIRIRLSGKDLPVQILEGLDLGGVVNQETIFSEFYADLEIGREGLQDIVYLRAKSPEMEFEFGQT